MAKFEQIPEVQGRAKARRTALIVGLFALAVYGGFFLMML